MREGLTETLEYIQKHTAGQTRMPLLVGGRPGTGRLYHILQAIASTAKTDITKERILKGMTDDVLIILGTDPIADIRDIFKGYYEREQPTELNHKHIIVRALDQASQAVNDMLLKITEEPPTNTIITLTASDPRSVMPAIASRTIHVHMPDHDHDSMRHLFINSVKLKAALPTLSRSFPPRGTNEARNRYRYNLDHWADSIAHARTTPAEIRAAVLQMHKDGKHDICAIITTLIRLTEKHLMRVVSGRRGSMAGLAILHQVTEDESTRFIEMGKPERATSIPNGATLTLCSYLSLAMLIKDQKAA